MLEALLVARVPGLLTVRAHIPFNYPGKGRGWGPDRTNDLVGTRYDAEVLQSPIRSVEAESQSLGGASW